MVDRRSPEEIKKAKAAAQEVMEKRKRTDGEKHIKRARGTLIFLGILMCGVALWEGLGPMESELAMIIDFVIAGIFLGSWFLSKQYPFPAFLTSLLVYLLIHILIAIGDPASLFSGIIWKIVIIAFLASGTKAARKYHQPKKEISDDVLDSVELDDL